MKFNLYVPIPLCMFISYGTYFVCVNAFQFSEFTSTAIGVLISVLIIVLFSHKDSKGERHG